MSKPAKPKPEILDEVIGPDVKITEDSRARKEEDLFIDLAVLRERIDHSATQSWVWFRLFGVATTLLFIVLGIIGAMGAWVRGLTSWLLELK